MTPNFKAFLIGLVAIGLLAFGCQARAGLSITTSELVDVATVYEDFIEGYLSGMRDGMAARHMADIAADADVETMNAILSSPECLYSMKPEDLVAVIRLRARTHPDELVGVTLVRLTGGC